MSSGGLPTALAQSIWARSLGTAGLRYASLIVGFALSVVIARTLGPEGRGQYYYPILVGLTLQAFLHLGLDPANVLLFSQRKVPYQDLVTQSGAFALLMGATGAVAGLAGWFILRDSLMSGVPLAHFVLVLTPL